MDLTILYWHWLVFGMLLVIFEVFLPSFTALWFGLGAILVGVLVWVVPSISLSWQVLVWALSSATATWFWFRYFKPRAINRTMAGMSREAIIGEVGHVILLPREHQRGKLRFSVPILGADEWDFICQQDVQTGDRVIVTEVSGNTLMVNKQ
jgi:hypothetical protein